MKWRLPILARLASLKAQGVTVRSPTSHQQVEGAEGLPGGVDMKLTEKEVAAFRRRFLGGNKDGMGTLTQAAAAVAPPPPRDPLSNTMKDRLIRESAGLGADPNQKNPFLPVFFGVGVFVLLGALAVNM